jgi:molybdopterin biosynthesis enzyme MoaB
VTVSDSAAAGRRENLGAEACRLLRDAGLQVEGPVVADERAEVAARLRDAAERSTLVVTTGGTGLGLAT